MRVLHIAQSVSGGIASYLEEIAAYQLGKFGSHSVRFLVPAGNRHHLPSVPLAQLIEFSPCSRSAAGFAALWWSARREIAGFMPDVVHLHSTYAGVMGRLALPVFGARPSIVYCAHGWSFGMEAARWKQKLYATVERALLPATDMIVNISHSDHALAQVNGIPSARMTTIRNGIAPVVPSGATLAQQFDHRKLNLIFVGRHDRQKGLDILIDAFLSSGRSDMQLHVVGAPVLDWDSGLVAGEHRLNVTFHGWQSRDAVSQLIAASDALVMPSRWEGFGLVALEAMRLGKPVLASRRGALSEIVHHGRNGWLFDISDVSELRGLLSSLDKSCLSDMGDAARQDFLDSFTSDRLNSELVALYEYLARRKLRSTAGLGLERLWRHE